MLYPDIFCPYTVLRQLRLYWKTLLPTVLLRFNTIGEKFYA